MRIVRRIGVVVLLLAVGGATALATKRDSRDVCKHFAKQVQGFGMKPGEWGPIPKELRELPPGAKLCGSTGFVTVIASPIEGKALQDYYTPLMARAGCRNLSCQINSVQTDCNCQHTDRSGHSWPGRVLTDAGLEVYKLFY